MYNLGFIGYGLRARTMMQAFTETQSPIAPAAIADPRCAEIAAQYKQDVLFANTRYYASAEQMLEAESALDGVFIGTRCTLHAGLAAQVIEAELPLFLEKPVCTSDEEYASLLRISRGHAHRVVVSFPLRFTPVMQRMKQLIASGALGKISMVQAINNVPYGSVYYNSWYRNPAETGGLFLQKTTHDIDYIMYLLGQRPVQAAAMTTKLYYTGARPAGLHCPACDEYHTCPESSHVVETMHGEAPTGTACCFARDTGNEDGATVLFKTREGVLISYAQNFVVKNPAGRRGARFIGTKGSAEFDFYTGEVIHHNYHAAAPAIHSCSAPSVGHWGGDKGLATAFSEVLDGKPSSVGLESGLASAACCLAACRSAQASQFVPVDYGFAE